MTKSFCINFPTCHSLTKRFGVDQQILNVFINLYNTRVPAEERIAPDKEYSEQELDEIYNKIVKQREENSKNKKYLSEERDIIIRTIGGPEALAFQEMTAVFDAAEIEELTDEFGRRAIDKFAAKAREHNCTIEAYIRKYGTDIIKVIFNEIAVEYRDKLEEALGILNGEIPTESSNIQTAEQAEKVVDIVSRLLNKGRKAGRVIESLKIMSLSVINKALDLRIHGDFDIETDGTVEYEIADSVQDTEAPMQERYMMALDAQGLEDSLSGIISRVLMQLPKTKTVVETKVDVIEAGGKKIEVVNPTTRTEIVKSTVFGESLYSNPKVIARRLLNILSGITRESEMIQILKGAGYTQIAEKLDKDSSLRTTFFQDFNKYTQTYRAAEITATADGSFHIKVVPLGRSKNDGVDSYKQRLKTGNISKNSIFEIDETDKKVKLKKLTYFYGVKSWFEKTFFTKAADGNLILEGSVFDKASPSMKESYIVSIMEFLNIPTTEKGIGILLSDESKLSQFLRSADMILSFFEIGDNNLDKHFSKINRNINGKFLNQEKISSAIGNIMNIIEATPKSFYGGRVTYLGSGFSTSIMNSPLSILAKKINGLYDRPVNGEMQRDLTNYLMARFLHSPQYMKDGRVLNRWLRDFLACSTEPLETCAKSIFGFGRDLGIGGVRVEDISDRDHMLLLVSGYIDGRSFAQTEDVVVSTDKEAIHPGDGKRYIVAGTPYYYQRGKKMYRTDVSHIPSFITGDTNAIRQIRTIHYYEEEILDDMYDLFLADKENQKIIKYFNDRGITFSANGKEAYASRQVKVNKKASRRSNADKFGILNFLNTKRDKNTTWYEYFIQKAAERQGLDPKSLTKDERISVEADKVTFKEVVSEYLNEGFKSFKKQLSSLGLLDKTQDGKSIYFGDYVSGANNTEELLDKYLKEFYLDYKFSQYTQAHLMQVNPLFLNGVEDYQKRNKGVLTNGYVLSMEAKDKEGNYIWDYDPATNTFDFNSRVAYFKDVKVGLDEASKEVLIRYYTKQFAKISKSPEEAELKARAHVAKFNSNSLTDGQAYRTFDSYAKVLMSAGKTFWTDEHQKAYDLIMSIVTPIREARRRGETLELTVEQIQQIEDAAAVFPPIKPINDGTEIYGTEMGPINIPFQFKYAEVLIIPELLPANSKLRELGYEMLDRGIDLLASDKCLKKGCFGELDLQYKIIKGQYVDAKGNILPGMNADGKIIDDGTQTAAEQRANPENKGKFVEWEEGTSVKDIFAAHATGLDNPGFVTHIISMENYLIQSNIPNHTDGNSIIGVQGRKIGTGAIIKEDGYYYTIGNKGNQKGTKISGKDLARLYGVAHAVKYVKSFGKFTERVDNVSDIVSDLIYNILNSGRGNLATISKLSLVDGKNPTIPFSEPSVSTEIEGSLISIFKKMVIRQLISGGSIVQASSLGYGSKALSDTGLHAVIKDGVPTAMQTEMPFDFHYTDENGQMHPLRYEDYCDENGYFLDAEGNSITEDRYDTAIPKIELDYPGITDIVAYRIPTEMEYSMFHLKIVKCNPRTTTNTIKLPAECTKIAGFDFDIDKLFLMRHNFKAQAISNEEVWKYIYKKNEAFWKALGIEHELDGSPNVEWHTYWNKVLEKYPSWEEEYGNKKEVFNKAKEELQRGKIAESRMNYSINPESLIDLSQGELDNLLIDCMVSILSDESTVGDRYSIGGFDGPSADAKFLRLLMAGEWNDEVEDYEAFSERAEDLDDVKPEYDYSEPMTAIIFKEQNQIAGTLIGIFANDSINAFISKGLKTFRITDSKNRILFGSLLKGITELDGKIKDISDSDIGLSFLHTSVNGVSIKKTLAALLAASVDAVKDPVLNYLNLNVITADAAAMLARLGYTTRDIGLLFNQPIIKRMCVYMNRSGETNVRRALITVLQEMGSAAPSDLFKNGVSADTSKLTSENLAKNLNPFNTPDLKTQEAVAQLFNSIMLTRAEFSNFVQETRNTSSNTLKSRFSDYLSSEDKSGRDRSRITIVTNDEIEYPMVIDITEEALTDPKKFKEIITKYKDHPFLYETVVASIIKVGMNHMMEGYTLYNTPLYTGYKDILQQLAAPWGLSGDQIEQLFTDIPLMELSSMPGDFNPLYQSDGEIPNAIKYVHPEYFINDFIDFLQNNPELIDLPILSIVDIDPSSRKVGAMPRLTFKYSRSISDTEKLAFTLSWDYLFNLGGKATEIAKGLYLHFYYTRGLNPKTNVSMELAPPSVLNSLIVDRSDGSELTYTDYFDKTQPQYSKEITSSIDEELEAKKKLYQFLISHSGNSLFARKINVSLEDCKSEGSEELIFRAGPIEKVKNSASLVTLQSVKNNGVTVGTFYAPVIKIEGKTYVLAKVSDGGYEIDYDNYKTFAEKTVRYVPATLVLESSPLLHEKLSTAITDQNSLIFKEISDGVTLNKVIDNEEVTTDTTDSEGGVSDAYDKAEEKTKNDEVESSDGREKCHKH